MRQNQRPSLDTEIYYYGEAIKELNTKAIFV